MNKYLLLFCTFSASLFAKPQDFHVRHGGAKIIDAYQGMTVHSGDKTVIDWGSFSIGLKESVIFNQSSSSSAILNRVIGSELSNIQGTLTSNGHVFLINPNGIIVGKKGVIQTNGFIASTLDLSNEQFLQRDGLTFKGKESGSIVNLGKIEALSGDIFLIGASIQNEGVLTAPMGAIGLALGTTIHLTPVLGQYLSIQYTINESSSEKGIENSGIIEGGDIALIAHQNPYSLAIKQHGTLEATGVRSEGGKIFLVAEEGGIDIAGTVRSQHGDIHLLGDRIEIAPDTKVVAFEGDVLIGNEGKESTAIITHRGTELKGLNVLLKAVEAQRFNGEIIASESASLTSLEGHLDIEGRIIAEKGDIHLLGDQVEIAPNTEVVAFEGDVLIGNEGKESTAIITHPTAQLKGRHLSLKACQLQEFSGEIIGSQSVRLSALEGFLEVNGKIHVPEGLCYILAKDIHLGPETWVDVSGDRGGIIRVGGDYKGSNPKIPNAESLIVDAGARFSADGLTHDAGKIIFWSNQKTHFSGEASAQAFGNKGDGGFVEVSAKSNDYRFLGQVNTFSKYGKTGTLLLDPVDITVGNFGGTSTPAFPTAAPGTYQPSGIASANLDVTNIQTALGSNNVIIDSTAAGTGNGDVIFALGPTWSANTTLTVTAHRYIWVQSTAAISSTNALSSSGVIFTAQGNGTVTSGGNADGIRIDGIVSTVGGQITFNGTGVSTGLGLHSSGINIVKAVPSSIVTTTTGPISFTGVGNTTPLEGNGIRISGVVRATGNAPDLTIHGTGASGTTNAGSNGTIIRDGGQVTAAGTTNISITGITNNPNANNTGFEIFNSSSCTATGTGNITIIADTQSGTGISDPSLPPQGVSINQNATLSTTSGTITMTITNASPVNQGKGIEIIGGNAFIESTSGAINITSTLSGAGQDGVACYINGGEIRSGSGDITLNAQNTSTTGSNQVGIQIVNGSSSIKTTSGGQLNITGVGKGSGGAGRGIVVSSLGFISASGNATITGTATGSGISNNEGVRVESGGKIEALSTATLTVTGTGSGPGDECNGLHVDGLVGASEISVVDGNMILNGFGSPGGSAGADGIFITNSGTVRTKGSGNLTLNGTAQSTTGTVHTGVELNSSGTVSSIAPATGTITLNGTGTNAGPQNQGIYILSGGIAQSTSGAITINGTSAGTNTTNFGFGLTNGAVQTVSGPIIVTASNTGGTSACYGMFMESTSTITSTSSNITINATNSAPSGFTQEGFLLTGAGSKIESGTGQITVTGTGGGNSGQNRGVVVNSSGSINTTSTGAVQVTGTGGGGSQSHGTHVTSSGVIRSDGGGSVTVNGTGSLDVAGATNCGVIVDSLGSVRAQNGSVTITGTGGTGIFDCDGVFLDTGGLMTTPNSSYQVTGNSLSGFNSSGVDVSVLTSITAGGSGNVSIVGHSTSTGADCAGVIITGSTISATGTGNVSITNGIAPQSGGTGPGGELGIGIANATISANSGNITITGRGGTTASLPGSTGGNHGVFLIGGSITTPGSIDITGIGGESQVTNQGVRIIGTSVIGSGTNTVSITGTGATTAASPSTQNAGIYISNGIVRSVGGGFSLNGIGGSSVSGENHGIYLLGNALVESQAVGVATPLSIIGTANSGSASHGILMNQGGVKTVSTSPLTMQGTTNSTDTGTVGIFVQNNQSPILASIDVGAGGLSFTGTGSTGANQSAGYELNTTTVKGTGSMTLEGVSRDTSGSPLAAKIMTSNVTTSGTNLILRGVDGEWCDKGAGGSNFEVTGGGQLDILTTSGGLARGGHISFIGTTVSTVKTASGQANIIAVGTGRNVTMGLSGSVTTTGGNAKITAPNNVILGRVTVPTSVGPTINVTATGGAISNGTGTILTPALVGHTAALTAATGAGSGTSSSVTAIPTNITNLGGSITGIGDMVIYELDGLNLNAISTNNGGLDINAGGAITQSSPLSIAGASGHAYFTTSRATTIGTAAITNTINSKLGESLIAGDYTFVTSPASTVTLSGNQTIGRHFSITSTPGGYNQAGFTVITGGTYTNNGSPVAPAATNIINAFGPAPNFDISTATLAATGDITINLRGAIQTPTNVQTDPAVTLNNVSNSISGPIHVTTVDPAFNPVTTDYNLIQSNPLTLNPGQNLIINAVRGISDPAVSNPVNSFPSGFSGSTLPLGFGSSVNLTNGSNSFGGWVSIRDAFTAQVVSNGNIALQAVNAYGDLTITANNGSITTGAGPGPGNTIRSSGNTIAFSTVTSGDITINGAVSNLTTSGTPQGTITYTSAANINGTATTTASNVALSATSGTIGLIASRVNVAAPNIVFSSQGNTFLGIPQTTTIAGDAGAGGVDILLTAAGDLTISSQTIGSLSKNGLQAAGVGNGITAVTNNGGITVSQPVAATGNGAINLNAVGGLETINQAVSSVGGAITLTGGTGITHSATGDITTNGTGTITATATSGDLTMVDGTQYQTAGGNVTLTSSGNTVLGVVNAATGDVRSTATSGAITNVSTATEHLLANRAHLTAANGIGVNATPIRTALSELQANVTGTGDLYVLETNAVSLTNWDGASPGISTANGVVSIINTTGDQTVGTNVSVGGATNTLLLQATAGALTMNNGTIASTAGGNASLLANTNIALSQVNAGVGAITATATTGSISNITGSLTPPNLTAATATLSSFTGTGSGLPSSTTAISTNLTNLGGGTTAGSMVIRESDALNLNNITTIGGGLSIDAGGLVQQNPATTLVINGELFIETSRDGSIGTVSFSNTVPTLLGPSTIAGDWVVSTSPTPNTGPSISLTGNSTVGRNYTFTGGSYSTGGFTITEGGDAIVNGLDPDLTGPTINATGIGPDFDISLATLGAATPITVNLRNVINSFPTVVTDPAITVANVTNIVPGNAIFITRNPGANNPTQRDYNLVQTTPITLNAGQTMVVVAARGALNPPVSPVGLNSPFASSTLNGNKGSNITLNLANNFNGTLVIEDPNTASINAAGSLSVGHINTYGDLTLISQGGTITTGAVPTQSVRSAGSSISFSAPSTITLGEKVQAIDTSGNPSGNIFYTSSGGNIVNLAAVLAGNSNAGGISFDAPMGSIGTSVNPLSTAANRIVFSGREAFVSNSNLALSVAGQTSSGGINLVQGGTPIFPVTIGGTTVGAVTRNDLIAVGGNIQVTNSVSSIFANQNITATGQTINLNATNGSIQQGGGTISTGPTAGSTSLMAISGITGVGPNSSVLIESLGIFGQNGNTGELNITNRLVGPDTLEATAILINGMGTAALGKNIYYNQEGGSSVNFAAVVGDGTATLLAIQDEANMRFSGNVQIGSKYISVANKNVDIENILVSILDDVTIVCDQNIPTSPGPGVFSNQGTFVLGTNNLAVYASSGPEALPNVIEAPPTRVVLGGTLASLATWDNSKPGGLDSKYETSYSSGGPVHGPGFGTDYIPGNGVFGSQVIWYKFNPNYFPPPSAGIDFKGVLRLIGINAWVDKSYFMNEWFKGPFCTGRAELFNTACDKEEIDRCKL